MKKKTDADEVVTKGYLRTEFNKFRVATDEKAREYRDQILTRLDDVMKELETMREENTIGTYQIRELREQGGDHEKRITQLERTQKAA